MADVDTQSGAGALAAAIQASHQVAYVTRDSERGREAAEAVLGVGAFDVLDLALDVVDESGVKLAETRITASFALDRSFEIIEPVDDPYDLFGVSGSDGQAPLEFHHVGAIVGDLEPSLQAARERSLSVVRLQVPGMEAAFIDLRPLGGHRLELLCLGS